jgi:HEPN domain-containing protein
MRRGRGRAAGRRVDDFSAEDYRRAALDRMVAAQRLFDGEDYVLASYVAGVAVECLLLAYLRKLNKHRDDRHDIRQLAMRSEFIEQFRRNPELQDQMAGYLADLAKRWNNDHRYRSVYSFERYLNAKELYRTAEGGFVKGDNLLRTQTKLLVEAAYQLVRRGDERWTS